MNHVLPVAETEERGSVLLPDPVKQVLESQTFSKSPALRALLTYLWQRRTKSLSEYAIATEALGRSPSFDARTDATVRVQVSRLRQRLDKFYEKEQPLASERLFIPVGSHQVSIERSSSAVVAVELLERPPVSSPSSADSRARLFWRPCSAVLLLVCMAEAGFLVRGRAVKPVPNSSAPWLWQNFFANGRGARVALPTPTFFSFREPNNGVVMFRDTTVNDFASGVTSPYFRSLTQLLGQPTLAENYTVTSDTFASVQLTRYLDQFKFNTSVTSSADDPLGALDRENVIAVGTWGTLRPLQSYLDRMNFVLGPHGEFLESRNPLPGEPKRIDVVAESPDRGIWPGVVAVLPGNGGQTHLLLAASRHTLALVCLLIESNSLAELEKLWRAKGAPEYFEVAVKAELSGRGVVRVWPTALHPFTRTP